MISEAYSVLANDDRRRHYDKYGTVMDDEKDEAAYFREFEEMFFKGGGFTEFDDDFDDFLSFLEGDDIFNEKEFKKLFRGMGKCYRVGGGKRSNKPKFDLLDMLMNPMAGGVSKKKSKKKSKK